MRSQMHAADIAKGGPVWAAQAFLLSLLIPFYLPVGPLLLMPHRIVLIVLFIPFFLKLFVSRTAGPVLAADWLLFLSTLWAAVAMLANHPLGVVVEPIGIHIVEFFGAYLVARVAIRSSADFRRMAKTFFLIVLFLLPFAAAESLTRRPILLDLLPGNSVRVTDGGIRMGMRRAQTIFAHPILFGVFVSTGLGIFWYALRPRGLRFIGAPAAIMATIFSLSTGALISLVVQSLFIGWEMALRTLRARWRLFAAFSFIGYILIDLLSNRSPFHVLVTYGTFYTGSAYNRIRIWEHGTENVWNNPLFGLGLNDWERPSWMSSSVDNFWLLIAMRYGFPAIIMVVIALVLILRRVARKDLSDEGDALARAGYLVAFGGLCIAGGTVHYWHAMMAFVMFIFGTGLWCCTGGVQKRPDENTNSTESPSPKRRSKYSRQPDVGGPVGGMVARSMPDTPRVPLMRRSRPARARTTRDI